MFVLLCLLIILLFVPVVSPPGETFSHTFVCVSSVFVRFVSEYLLLCSCFVLLYVSFYFGCLYPYTGIKCIILAL